MDRQESLIESYQRQYLMEHRDEWLESWKKLIEQFPYLKVVTAMPYPCEVKVWKNIVHLDGFIYFFDKKANEDFSKTFPDPSTPDGYVYDREDMYFCEHLESYPIANLNFDSFEEFLDEFAHKYRTLERQNSALEMLLCVRAYTFLNLKILILCVMIRLFYLTTAMAKMRA